MEERKDITVSISGRGDFSECQTEYDADCVVVHVFNSMEDSEEGDVDIITEIKGKLEVDNLVGSLALASASLLDGLAQDIDEELRYVYGKFFNVLTHEILRIAKERGEVMP